MLDYLTQLFCGHCSDFDLLLNHKTIISICALLSCILLLRFLNIFLLGFTNSKSKKSFIRQKFQTFVLFVGLLDSLCAILPLAFIGSNLHFNNFPIVHVCDSFLSISSFLMNKDLLRSKRISFHGLLSSLVISLLTFPLYVYLFISLTPHFMNSSAYQQSLVILCLIRMIFSLSFSIIISYLLSNLIDPSAAADHGPSYRSLSNASSSNNIGMINLGFEWGEGNHHNFLQWEEPHSTSTSTEQREMEREDQQHSRVMMMEEVEMMQEEEEEEEYETYYEYLFVTVISSVFEKASKSQFAGVDDMPSLSSEAQCHHQINFLSTAIATHFSSPPAPTPPPASLLAPAPTPLQPKASHLFLLIFSRYSFDFLLTALLVLLKSTLQFIGPLMLQQLVLSAQQNKPWSHISIQIFILFFSRFCCSFLDTHYHLLSQELSIKLSGALKGSLFRKIISLSSTSRLRFTIGNLTNLYTVDIDRIVEVIKDVHNFWSLPLQVSFHSFLP
jgi:hypothetical protein